MKYCNFYKKQCMDTLCSAFPNPSECPDLTEMKEAKAETVWFWECPHCQVNDFADIPEDVKYPYSFIVECDYCHKEILVVIENKI